MNGATRFMLTLIACFVTGVASFYLGVESGARSVHALSNQNSVARALSRIDAALSAVDKNDLVYSQRVHQGELRAALSDLGTYSEAVPNWQCSDRDRRITSAATKFLGSRAQSASIARTSAIERALRFCAQGSDTDAK